MFLSGVNAIIALSTIVFIWKGVGEVFSLNPNITMTSGTKIYGWVAMGSALLAMLIYFVSLLCTHFSAFRIAKNMRVKAMSHLMTLPLVYFNATSSGKIRRIIVDSALKRKLTSHTNYPI